MPEGGLHVWLNTDFLFIPWLATQVIQQGQCVNNILHVVLDEGSVGDPGINWLFRQCRIKGTHLWDRLHRVINDWGAGLSAAGLQTTCFEWSSVLTLRKGPFGKQANHRVLQGVARDMLNKLDHTNAIFEFLYPDISKAMVEHDLPEYGSNKHMECVWQRLMARLCGQKMGKNPKSNRWWSLEARGLAFLGNEAEYLGTFMLLVYLGYTRGWWTRFEKSPLLGFLDQELAEDAAEADDGLDAAILDTSSDEGEDLADDLGDGDADPQPKSKGEARKQVADLKRKALHSMHFAAQVMGRPLSKRLFHGMCLFSEPLQQVFGEEMQLLASQWGTADLHMELVQGFFEKNLCKMMQHLCSKSFAQKLGFIDALGHADGKAVTNEKVARAVWRLAKASTSAMSLTNLTYTALPPLCFLNLVHPNAEVVEAWMPRIKHMWEILLELEKASLKSTACEKWVTSLRFPREQYVRSIFVQLAEVDFAHVPAAVFQELTEFLRAPKSTLLIENCGNLCRRVEKKTGCGKCSPLMAWTRMANSTLLDEFELSKVQVTTAAACAGPEMIKQGVFEASPNDSSLSDEQFETLHVKKATWPAQDALARRMAAFHWWSAELHQGNWEQMQPLIWSKLMMPGVLAIRDGDPQGYFVLMSTTMAFLAWRVEQSKAPNDGVQLEWGPVADGPSLLFVRDPDEWKCIAVKLAFPGDPVLDPGRKLSKLTPLLVDEQVPLKEYAARQGLTGFNLAELQKLYRTLQVAKDAHGRPKTKAAYLLAIIKHLLPDMEHEQLEAVMNKHDEAVADEAEPSALLFNQDVMGLVLQELGDENMEEEYYKCRDRFQAAKLKQQTDRRAAAKVIMDAGGEAASSQAGAEIRKIHWPDERGYTQAEAKRFLPPACTLRKDVKRDPRWQIRADWLSPSVSRGYARDDVGADNHALLACLRIAWAKHTALFSSCCPWDIGGELL